MNTHHQHSVIKLAECLPIRFDSVWRWCSVFAGIIVLVISVAVSAQEQGSASLKTQSAASNLDPECPVALLPEKSKSKTHLFLVHGTYAGNEKWTQELEEKVTFASEAVRGLGGDVIVHPFVWSAKNTHESRMKAARNLAVEMERHTKRGEHILIVGHSHGGNVAMQAAAFCERVVDMVICLSTPHMYLVMSNEDEAEVKLPIYCPPNNANKIKQIISIRPSTDDVPGYWAEIDGIDDDDALAATLEWRTGKNLNLPMVADPFHELLERIKLVDEVKNIRAEPELAVAHTNIEYLSQVKGIEDSHSAVHSHRMGYLVGVLARIGPSLEMVAYLESLVQPKSTSYGAPVNYSKRQELRLKQIEDGKYNFIGAKLMEAVASVPNKVVAGNEEPDLFFNIHDSETREEVFESEEVDDMLRAVWDQKMLDDFILYADAGLVQLWEDDFVGNDKLSKKREFAFDVNKKDRINEIEFKEKSYTLYMKWRLLHN
ncbi:MAG: esterase/lipase family protein [Pirellulaceae bacterium]